MKRILSLVLVLVILIGVALPVFADSSATEDLAKYGVISGDESGYNEKGVLTRAQFTVLLSQLYGLKDIAEGYAFSSSYSDLVKGEWYVPYVAFSEAKGWMSGMGDGTFAPNDPMTSQQVNAMFVKALGYNVSWDDVNSKASELKISIVASNSNSVLRVEAFKALRKALDVVPNGSSYTLGTKLELVGYESDIEGAPVVTIPPGEVGIVSIKALNLKQIEVVYNTTITDSGDESNYSIDTEGNAVLDSSSDFSIQEDGKTVVITLTDEADQQEKLVFEVRKMFEINESKSLQFIDLKPPTVLNVEGVSLETVRVNFSEPMQSGLTTKSNYSAETSKGTGLYISKITAGKNNMSALIDFYTELKGTEIITIKDMKDYSGYKILSIDKVVKMNIDSDPPVVKSYKNADQNSVTLVFDSEIEFVDASKSNYYYSNTSNIATDISIDENEMTLEFKDAVPSGTTTVFIDKYSIKDKWGNKNDKISKKVEIVVDNIAPKMIGDLDVLSQTSIEITFDQDVTETGDDFDVELRDDNGHVVDFKSFATATNEKLEITFDEDLFGSYTIDIDGVEDENENQASGLQLRFVVVDETAPDVDDFEALLYDGAMQLIRIDYHEEMDEDIITDKAYYFYGDESLDDDEVTIRAIDNNTAVELEVPSDFINITEGRDIIIGRVSDASGNLMKGIYGELELFDGEDVKLEIKSVELINENTVILTLENDILAGIDKDRFSFNLDIEIDKAYPGINDASESIVTFVLEDDVDSGDRIKLTVLSNAGENVYGQSLETGTFTVTDTSAPVVLKVDYVGSEKIVIEFNEPLDSNTFSVAGHNGFSVAGGNAELISVDYSASELTIRGTGFTEDTNVYYNSIFGITDTSGNALEDFSKTSRLD